MILDAVQLLCKDDEADFGIICVPTLLDPLRSNAIDRIVPSSNMNVIGKMAYDLEHYQFLEKGTMTTLGAFQMVHKDFCCQMYDF